MIKTTRARLPHISNVLASSAFVAAACVIAPGAQAAQETGYPALEEIVVTAQKREQNIQDVGISIAALSQDQLRDMGIASTDQLAGLVPGVQIFQFGQQATTTISVRGVSQNDIADHNEAPVALYQDGAYNSFIGGAGLALFDIERVEILRGPQGTLFGRNATGGLVQIVSRKPTRTFDGYLQAGGGDYGFTQVEGAIGGPLTETVASRLAVSATRDDGFIKNTAGPRKEKTRGVNTRLQFDIKPADGLDVLLSFRGVRDDVDGTVGYKTRPAVFFPGVNNGLVDFAANAAQYQSFCGGFFGAATPAGSSDCFGFQDPDPANPWKIANDTQGVMDRTILGTTATVTWDIAPSVTLTSISDYLQLERNYVEDTDGTSAKLFNFYSDMDSRQISQELRLNGNTDRITWQTGLYFLDIQHDILTGADANSGFNSGPGGTDFFTRNGNEQSTRSYSVFAQIDWSLASTWNLTTGMRWVHDKKDMEIDTFCLGAGCDTLGFNAPGIVQGTGFNETVAPGLTRRSDSDIAAKVELDWRPTDDTLTYFSINRGIKGGGFNAAAISAIPLSYVPYKPEVLTAYELGLKQTFMDGRARVNASVFYYDYKDYQAFTLTGFSPLVFNTDNQTQGGEVELLLRPLQGLSINLGAAYLDAIAEKVPLQFGVGPFVDQRPPQSPSWTFNASVRQEWTLANDGALAFQITANHVGKRYFNTINHPGLADEGYTTENVRLSYVTPTSRWEGALWINNLTDTHYISTAFDLSTTNGVIVQAYAPPRQVGATLTYRFGGKY